MPPIHLKILISIAFFRNMFLNCPTFQFIKHHWFYIPILLNPPNLRQTCLHIMEKDYKRGETLQKKKAQFSTKEPSPEKETRMNGEWIALKDLN